MRMKNQKEMLTLSTNRRQEGETKTQNKKLNLSNQANKEATVKLSKKA